MMIRTGTETGRTVVITGASGGLGAAAVRAFADRGDRMCGTMRNAEGRNTARKPELEARSPRIAIAQTDAIDDTRVADGFARILGERPVDILIDDAGIKTSPAPERTTPMMTTLIAAKRRRRNSVTT